MATLLLAEVTTAGSATSPPRALTAAIAIRRARSHVLVAGKNVGAAAEAAAKLARRREGAASPTTRSMRTASPSRWRR